VWAVVQEIDPNASHASWMENFPRTRLEGVELPGEAKPMVDMALLETEAPEGVRRGLGDGSYGGLYERPDVELERIWQAGVEEARDLLEHGWRR
jgi:creatinine amidohydrolase